MAIVKVEHIYATMRKENVPYWRVTDNGGVKNRIDENDNEENVETAVELLEACLDNVEDNIVCIMLSNKTRAGKAGGGRGFKQFEFKINLARNNAAGFNGGNAGMFAMVMQMMKENSELSRKLEMTTRDQQIEDLKKQMKELKKGDKNSVWEALIPEIVSTLKSKKGSVAIAGDEDETVDEELVNQQEKTRNALKRLAKVDKNLPETLTKLADFAENHKMQYKLMLPMLDNPEEFFETKKKK